MQGQNFSGDLAILAILAISAIVVSRQQSYVPPYTVRLMEILTTSM
jgi:hypothetical protein